MGKKATASLERLRKIFSFPTTRDSTLFKIEKEISRHLLAFLHSKVVAADMKPRELEKFFRAYEIPRDPVFVSEQTEFLLRTVVPQAVNTSAPKFIGHMASALPHFMMPLTGIMTALNQNLVKTETSKSFTPLERQVIGMLHHLIYRRAREFYVSFMHDSEVALGTFCSGGTVANITALWIARNKLLAPQVQDGQTIFAGVREEGVCAALQHYDLRGLAVLVSRRGHYSLAKTADILGLGRNMLITVETDSRHKISIKHLLSRIRKLQARKIGVMAIVGIAGTTETGNVDPLADLAEIAAATGCHFHVDAAWGGPTLFSKRYAGLLRGIERADTVTLDAHKQLYVPMAAGVVLCREATTLHHIGQQANYIVRKGSRDLGKHTLEGSRPGMALLVHSSLRIFGHKGFELLIDHGIDTTKQFAALIAKSENFELISTPELNVLTYRYHPRDLKHPDDPAARNELLNRLTTDIQRKQRGQGVSFVSRTTLRLDSIPIVVFRVVLANPLTTITHLKEILAEQEEIGHSLQDRL